MFRQLYIHVLLITFAVLFPSLTAAQDSLSCSSPSPNKCPWYEGAWVAVWTDLRHKACEQNITATTSAVSNGYQNPWATLQITLDTGYNNSNCWEATEIIIENCLDTNNGKYYQNGTWCSNSGCTERYSITMEPVSKTNCSSSNTGG
ncbi:hypothetical protein V8E54_000346 [Elaphomyces granulatus]